MYTAIFFPGRNIDARKHEREGIRAQRRAKSHMRMSLLFLFCERKATGGVFKRGATGSPQKETAPSEAAHLDIAPSPRRGRCQGADLLGDLRRRALFAQASLVSVGFV